MRFTHPPVQWVTTAVYTDTRRLGVKLTNHLNPLALELDIYSLAHHLCKMSIFYEPKSLSLGNTRHFVKE